jgi:DNA-binding transcriptional MerR regulator
MGDSSVNPTYTLEQLAEASGINERTIRSYIARGLLPPPVGRGRASSYESAHLVRLKFIQAVRTAARPYDLPLAKVEALLQTLPPEQVARIANGEEQVRSVLMGALDPSLLRRQRQSWRGAPPAMSMPTVHEASSDRLVRDHEPSYPFDPSLAFHPIVKVTRNAPAARRAAPSAHESSDSTWLGIDVTSEVRLSVRASDPQARERLLHLAGRLRAWLEGGHDE